MDFNQQLNNATHLIRILSIRYSRATNVPYEEFMSALYEEFHKKFDSFDQTKGDFGKFVKVILTQRALRIADRRRKERQFYDNILHIDGQVDEDGELMFEFEDTQVNVQATAIENIEKSPDKLQLIRALTESADEFTIAVVNRKLEDPNASSNSIATEMGVHHSKVDRCLRKLARNYDPSRFGDISQYLAS